MYTKPNKNEPDYYNKSGDTRLWFLSTRQGRFAAIIIIAILLGFLMIVNFFGLDI